MVSKEEENETVIPTIVQIQYTTRGKNPVLFALDSEGQIWFTMKPLTNGFIWKRVLLPYELRESEEVGDPEA